MQVSTLIFDLYGTLADIHTDETLPSLWRETAKDAGFDGAESYRTAYLRLCAEEVQIRAKTLPTVPEEWIEPELLHVFMRLHACGPQKARQAAKRFRERSTLRIGRMPHAIETLDGFLMAGGPDVDPAYYGAEELPSVNEICPERDAMEMTL